MSESGNPAPASAARAALGAIRVAGSDARAFLQGQLSNDLRALSATNSLLAALNTPQGRVVAVLRLIERTEGIYALVPASLASAVSERLRKYVLRSKVLLSIADDLRVAPLAGQFADTAGVIPAHASPTSAIHAQTGDVSLLRISGPAPRALIIAPAAALDDTLARRGIQAASWNDWTLAQIAAGEPQIYPGTSEQFVAQMLNLDLIDALSFNKGCYTGQEIIVRTQHLGRIKRRLIRAKSTEARVDIGAAVWAEGGSVGEVVDTAADGRGTELLAVVQVSALDAPLSVAGASSLQRMPLGYALPG